jgi:hypothetical protein
MADAGRGRNARGGPADTGDSCDQSAAMARGGYCINDSGSHCHHGLGRPIASKNKPKNLPQFRTDNAVDNHGHKAPKPRQSGLAVRCLFFQQAHTISLRPETFLSMKKKYVLAKMNNA